MGHDMLTLPVQSSGSPIKTAPALLSRPVHQAESKGRTRV